MTCPAAVCIPSDMNTCFVIFPLFIIHVTFITWMPYTAELFGRITYLPSTQTALVGQLKVTFEGLHWDQNGLRYSALNHRPLLKTQIRDKVRERRLVREGVQDKVTLFLEFLRGHERSFFFWYMQGLWWHEKALYRCLIVINFEFEEITDHFGLFRSTALVFL